MGKRIFYMGILICLTPVLLYGGTGRASDGHLLFLVVLGILAIILGAMYLVDYIRYLVNRFLSHHDHEEGIST